MNPILVTGFPRSGTSLTCGILHACGAWFGNTCGPTRWNRKGQFENQRIRDHFVKALLSQVGADPRGQSPLPPPAFSNGGEVPGMRLNILREIQKQGGRQNFAFKDPKLTLVWSAWDKAFPEAKWVITVRSRQEVEASCRKVGFIKNRPDNWLVEWLDHQSVLHEEMVLRMDGRCLLFHPFKIFRDVEEARFLVEWLGLKWNEKAVTDFAEASLWRNRHGSGD